MAIRRKEGTEAIQLDVKKKTPAEIGDVVVSTAGTLPQKCIFHVITIDYNSINQSNIPVAVSKEDIHQYIIGHSIDKCFLLLQAMDLKSIAFPSIGAGVAGIPFEKVASAMSEAIVRNLRKTNKSIGVELYLFEGFSMMERWNCLPMFEQFSVQEAITKMINKQSSERLIVDEVMASQPLEATPDIEKDVFISYSRKDSDVVKQIYEWLEKAGYK